MYRLNKENSAQTVDTDIQSKECICMSKKGLFIPNRHVSFIIVGIVASIICALGIGFFGGQNHVIEQFSQKFKNHTFADHIYSSVCALSDFNQLPTAIDVGEQKNITNNNVEYVHNDTIIHAGNENNDPNPIISTQEVITTNNIALEPKIYYYAELIGFGTARAAQAYAITLQKKGISVSVKKRISKTARGKSVTWYQVITKHYENKDELVTLVDRISKEEKLKDIRIITC